MKKIFYIIFGGFSIFCNAQKKWTLQECILYAHQNNLQVKQGEFQLKIQEKNLEISRKNKLPTISASISNTLSLGQGQDIFGNHQRNDNFNHSANLGAKVVIFNGKKMDKQIQKSQYEVVVSEYDLEKIKTDISLQIAQLYLNVLLNKEIEAIRISAFENTKKIYEKTQITTHVGTTAQSVLAEAEASMQREYQNLKSSEVETKKALMSLALLLQLQDSESFDVFRGFEENEEEYEVLSAEEIAMKSYGWHPKIKGAEEKIKITDKQIEIIKTNYLPYISANVGVRTSYFNALHMNKDRFFVEQYKDNFGQYLGVSLEIPIFNKNITKLQVEQAKIEREIANNYLLQQKQDLFQEIQRAEYLMKNYYDIYQSAILSEESSKKALDFAEKSYIAGHTTIYDFNHVINNHVATQAVMVQSKYNYYFQKKLLSFYLGNKMMQN